MLCAMRFGDDDDLDAIAASANDTHVRPVLGDLDAGHFQRALKLREAAEGRHGADQRRGRAWTPRCRWAATSNPAGAARTGRAGVEAYTELKSVSVLL